MRTLLLVAGARPNFMKLAPLLRLLRATPPAAEGHQAVRAVFVHTGQHYDHALSGNFLQQLHMPLPDYHLAVGSGSHAEQTAAALVAFERVCLAERPHLTVVVGDVNSTLACTLAAAKLGVPVAHVEAGLRSFDRRMPEEINRVASDALSELLFVTEQSGVDNLLAEGKRPDQVHLVGNVMIDTLVEQLALLEQPPPANQPHYPGMPRPGASPPCPGPYAVITLHRPSNVDQEARLQEIVQALALLARRLPVFFPMHPRTRRQLEGQALLPVLAAAGVRLLPPLGYAEFLTLWKDAALVLTDSGGLQEETTYLGVPCLTLRENTERPVTLTHGTNRLVPGGAADILAEALAVLESGPVVGHTPPPWWDGRTAPRIVQHLLAWEPYGGMAS